MERLITDLLEKIGEDINRKGLLGTPKRVVRDFQYLTSGYKTTLMDLSTSAVLESNSKDMVIVRDIGIYSICECHLIPFFGTCHVAYLPKGKVIRVSKIAKFDDEDIGDAWAF